MLPGWNENDDLECIQSGINRYKLSLNGRPSDNYKRMLIRALNESAIEFLETDLKIFPSEKGAEIIQLRPPKLKELDLQLTLFFLNDVVFSQLRPLMQGLKCLRLDEFRYYCEDQFNSILELYNVIAESDVEEMHYKIHMDSANTLLDHALIFAVIKSKVKRVVLENIGFVIFDIPENNITLYSMKENGKTIINPVLARNKKLYDLKQRIELHSKEESVVPLKVLSALDRDIQAFINEFQTSSALHFILELSILQKGISQLYYENGFKLVQNQQFNSARKMFFKIEKESEFFVSARFEVFQFENFAAVRTQRNKLTLAANALSALIVNNELIKLDPGQLRVLDACLDAALGVENSVENKILRGSSLRILQIQFIILKCLAEQARELLKALPRSSFFNYVVMDYSQFLTIDGISAKSLDEQVIKSLTHYARNLEKLPKLDSDMRKLIEALPADEETPKLQCV